MASLPSLKPMSFPEFALKKALIPFENIIYLGQAGRRTLFDTPIMLLGTGILYDISPVQTGGWDGGDYIFWFVGTVLLVQVLVRADRPGRFLE